MKKRRVLVPIDGTERSMHSLDFIKALLPKESLDIILMNVKELVLINGMAIADELKIADYLPDKGTPKLNWKQNSGVLRKFADGRPIRDVSPYPMKQAGFLGAERNLLKNRGYEYVGGFWIKKG